AIDLIFGEFSPAYMDWYNDGLIDDNFSAEFDAERNFAYLTIAAETADPELVIAEVSKMLTDLPAQVNQLKDSFHLVKNDALSRLINKLNQLEEIAIRFEGQTFDEATLQDEIAILQALTVNDMMTVLTETTVSSVASVIARSDMSELC
ncbi:insulinase family protein, partial [Weissella paramesenteroides]